MKKRKQRNYPTIRKPKNKTAESEALRKEQELAYLKKHSTGNIGVSKKHRKMLEILSKHKKCRLLKINNDILENIYEYRSMWIRPIDEWQPTSFNRTQQLHDLVQHLFCKYPIALIWVRCWESTSSLHHEWFVDLGRGSSILKLRGMADTLTKKQAHLLNQAPYQDLESIGVAVRWAQLVSMKADDALIKTILKGAIKDAISPRGDRPFWLEVIQFFVNHPFLARKHIDPLIDYIRTERFHPRDGKVWSIKGRSPLRLLEQMENWHRELNRLAKVQAKLVKAKSWDGVGIGFYDSEPFDDKNYHKKWFITEITTYSDLMREGRTLKHCVVSYHSSCATGKTSIWSLRQGDKKLLTIQVNPGSKSIIQVRGTVNRLPTDTEKSVIKKWAQQENLRYGG